MGDNVGPPLPTTTELGASVICFKGVGSDTTVGGKVGIMGDMIGFGLSLSNVSGVGASVANFLVGDCVAFSFDDVGLDVPVGDKFGLLVGGVGFGLPFPYGVGTPVTDTSVGDCVGFGKSVPNSLVGDCVGLSFDDAGLDAPVGSEFGLLVDAVWVGLPLPYGVTVGDKFGLFVDVVGFALS